MDTILGIAGVAENNWNDEEKRKNLKRKLQKLICIRDDISSKLDNLEFCSNKKRSREVSNWLIDVERANNEVQNLEVEMEESRWSMLWGRRVGKLTQEVEELIKDSNFERGLVLEECDTKGEPFIMPKLAGEAFEVNMAQIWEWLMMGDGVSCIGIYGMGGVGKTTLMSHIYNRLLESSTHNVFFITVSQDSSIYQLQDRVAKAVGLDLPLELSDMHRAARLSKALERKGRCVFIFDDLWNPFTLEEVGLRVDADHCRLVLTTRSLDICRRMGCEKEIKLEPLLEEESWNLFIENLGNYAALCAEVKHIARFVARECAGLPLGLVTMARSMRRVDDPKEWRWILEQLTDSSVGLGEMDGKVLQILKLSYTRLKDPALQECFLYCALFSEDWEIDGEELIECLISECIIRGKNRRVEFDRGHTMLNKLINACLLERPNVDNERFIKMHDLVRDMAIGVMKENSKAMVEAGKRLQKVPAEVEWSKDLVRASLMCNEIAEIPGGHSPMCPNLSTLLLCHNTSLRFIADSFFLHFHKVKVLDLSFTAITLLPHSICNLASLTCLLLIRCDKLCNVPSLATLKNLEKVDLSYTAVKAIPEGLEFLSDLKHLDMEGTAVEYLPEGVLSKLSRIQLLKLGRLVVFGFWLDCEVSCCLHNVQDFHSYIFGNEFRMMSYGFLIGKSTISGRHDRSINARWKEFNTVVFNEYNIGTNGELVLIPKDLGRLILIDCHNLKSLCGAPKDPVNVEHIEITGCKDIEMLISFSRSASIMLDTVKVLCLKCLPNLQVIISSSRAPSPSFLQNGAFSLLETLQISLCPNIKILFPCEVVHNLCNLKHLEVHDCDQMEKIIGNFGAGTFSRLETIIIWTCPNMKSLFPCEILAKLHALESIEVRDCCHMEEIFLSSEGGICGEALTSPTFDLPNLTDFSLKCLPKLSSICVGSLICNSIQSVTLFKCRRLKRIPLSLVRVEDAQPTPLPSLEKIFIHSGEPDWWESIDWEHPNTRDVLRPVLQYIKRPEILLRKQSVRLFDTTLTIYPSCF